MVMGMGGKGLHVNKNQKKLVLRCLFSVSV